MKGVSQGSSLGSVLQNIYINEIFFFDDEVFLSNHADDAELYLFYSKTTPSTNLFLRKV